MNGCDTWVFLYTFRSNRSDQKIFLQLISVVIITMYFRLQVREFSLITNIFTFTNWCDYCCLYFGQIGPEFFTSKTYFYHYKQMWWQYYCIYFGANKYFYHNKQWNGCGDYCIFQTTGPGLFTSKIYFYHHI